MNNQQFGTFINTLRKEKGLTQIQLAEMINTSDKAISRWENGKNYPDIEMLEVLANALGVSISELIACKHLDTDGEAANISEQAYVKEVKKSNRNRNKYIAITSVLLAIIVIITSSFFIVRESERQYTSQKIDMISSDITSNLKNITALMDQDHPGANFIVTDFEMNFDYDMNIELLNISGSCDNMHRHYAQSLANRDKLDYCKVYRSKAECGAVNNGVDIRSITNMLSQFDMTQFDPQAQKGSRYSITLLMSEHKYNEKISDIGCDCYTIIGSKLIKMADDDVLQGPYACFDLFKFNEISIANIFIPVGPKAVNETLESFFTAYGAGEYDKMKQYCSEKVISDVFNGDNVFGNTSAGLNHIEQVYFDNNSKYWSVELYQNIEPTEEKRRAFPTNREYLRYVFSPDGVIQDITTD